MQNTKSERSIDYYATNLSAAYFRCSITAKYICRLLMYMFYEASTSRPLQLFSVIENGNVVISTTLEMTTLTVYELGMRADTTHSGCHGNIMLEEWVIKPKATLNLLLLLLVLVLFPFQLLLNHLQLWKR